MLSSSHLKGQFLECCDCYTICPCWVKERPDEDHCNALYIWTFDEDSKIEGHPIGGKSVAAAAFYGNRGGLQAAIYADETLPRPVQQLLIDAFAGKTIASLQGLARLIGTVIDSGAARITRRLIPYGTNQGHWEVIVEVDGNRLAHATGTDATMEGRTKPLTLNNTALHDELGLHNLAVTVQAVDRFEMAVSSLPGGPFVYSGRSGMSATFDYS